MLRQHAAGMQQRAASIPCSSRPSQLRRPPALPQATNWTVRGAKAQPAAREARLGRLVCHATLDDLEMQELVHQLEAMLPPPPEYREQLDAAIRLIDDANSEDPTSVPVGARTLPYRLAYSQWSTEWVQRLYPKASDEMLILARGRNIQSWKLSSIRRDDYAPNTAGARQWELERKQWLTERLLEVVREVGYDGASQALIRDVMSGRNVPDPRDMRKYDLVGAFGMINYRTLEAALIVQALADADALIFLDKNFQEMFNRMPADEVLATLQRELSRMSQRAITAALRAKWTPVQQRLLMKALPIPFKYSSIMMDIEGTAAASTHPGDWRYHNFDYD